jgi:hypothetical protein
VDKKNLRRRLSADVFVAMDARSFAPGLPNNSKTSRLAPVVVMIA